LLIDQDQARQHRLICNREIHFAVRAAPAEVVSMHARMSKPDSVTVTVLLFTLGTLLTATLNVLMA
jgi:hypothetical protein